MEGPSSYELRTLVERHAARLLDHAPDAIVVIDRAARIVFANAETERIFGHVREELIGQPLSLLVPERHRAAHEGLVEAFIARGASRPMGAGRELVGRRRDGSEIAIEVSLGIFVHDEIPMVSATIRDVTERKRLEASARLSAERLASAVESIEDGLALYDASRRLLHCNGTYRRLFGADATPGTSYDALLRAWAEAELAAGDAEAWLAARRAGPGSCDVRTRSGRALRTTSRTTAEGGLVETVWDLTEDELRQRELREAREAAEAGSAAKTEFLSSMSHELRTPLNAVLGFAQLLQRDKASPLSERQSARVAQIVAGGEHLLRLIDDILDLSRIEAGGVAISPEPVEVAEVLAEVAATLEPLAARYDVTVALGDANGIAVAADRMRFAQILLNFGSNAVKYNRPGGTVRFEVSRGERDRVRVSVVDDGIGISAEHQAKLFQPFHRAGQELGPIEGTGIGLVVTKRLVELMGGSLGFRSDRAAGSTFWVELPGATPPGLRARVTVPSGEAPADGPARLVVYIEDNPANVRFMRDLVGMFDRVELVTAPTAELGIELVRARTPSLVILDINLPGMNGFDAMRTLRALPETASIPVIALTAAASERDRRRGQEAGFAHYLTKPLNVDEFVAVVTALFRSPPA